MSLKQQLQHIQNKLQKEHSQFQRQSGENNTEEMLQSKVATFTTLVILIWQMKKI